MTYLDHHATNDRFGDLNLVDEHATCSGMVAAKLLERLGVALDQLGDDARRHGLHLRRRRRPGRGPGAQRAVA